MMPNYAFSKAQLSVMNIADLRKLADYYQVDDKLPRGEMTKMILLRQVDSSWMTQDVKPEEPTMSVRLKRIKALAEGEN